MKVNAKLGGCNVALGGAAPSASLPAFLGPLGAPRAAAFLQRPYMIFGADVTHAAPGSNTPSLAAVVGSLDAAAGRYAARVARQAPTPGRQVEEIIHGMKDIVSAARRVHLNVFFGGADGVFRCQDQGIHAPRVLAASASSAHAWHRLLPLNFTLAARCAGQGAAAGVLRRHGRQAPRGAALLPRRRLRGPVRPGAAGEDSGMNKNGRMMTAPACLHACLWDARCAGLAATS